MAARRTLSLEDAARLAQERGILSPDYYALSRDQTDDLRALFDRTRWRQSASSAAMGRSKLYSFHLALQRAAPRRDRSRRDPAEPFSVSMTYEVVTPESAEHGDVEDRGYDYQDKRMSLSDVVREVESHGPYDEIQEMDDRRGALLRLYESDGSTDYRTGAETRHQLHIRGSERAIRRLAQVLDSRGVGRDRSRRRRRA